MHIVCTTIARVKRPDLDLICSVHYSPPYSLEAGYFAKPAAGLVVSKSLQYSYATHIQHCGYRFIKLHLACTMGAEDI